MEVDYEYTLEELVEYQIFFYTRSPHSKRIYFLTLASSSAVLLTVGFVLCVVVKSALPIVVAGLFCVGWIALFPKRWNKAMIKQARRICQQIYSGPKWNTLVISPEGIRNSTPDSKVEMAWTTLRQIEPHRAVTYFIFENGSALIVPDRSFPSVLERDVFVNEARNLWASSASPQ